MVFQKEELEKLIEERGITKLEDLQEFMREMTKEVIEALYEGEITDHLGHRRHARSENGNIRNGHTTKSVKSAVGELELDVPRDREGSYEPKIVRKRQKDITGLEERVISMYGLGMSTRDIQSHIEEIYGYSLSPESVSTITDTVLDRAKAWQNRPLQPVYAIVYMDALVIKLREERSIKPAVLYGIIGITLDGYKECLGLYLSREPESSRFWLSVMNELKNRGVKDILIFSVDNLKGISESITAAFPVSEIQKCIVHQIRNSLKHVSWKERWEVAQSLKKIYTAASEEAGLQALEDFKHQWDGKYPHVSKSWERNWSELATFFKYSKEIRKLIYTTNPIESFNRSLRKVSKNRPVFPHENAVIKVYYLATMRIEKKWTQKIRDWGQIYSQLLIQFNERLLPYL